MMKKIPTNYTAPVGKSYALELFIERVMNEIKEQKEPKTVGDNLTKEERLALNDMKKWTSNVIRPYDKGKGFMIDSREGYKEGMYKELDDGVTYKWLDGDEEAIIEKINNKFMDWSERALNNGDISKKIAKNIINNEAKAGKIYQLYKAHKPEKNYPRRTVASVCGAAIEHMSNWLEFYLAPVAKECKYRLEDTNDIINKLEEFNSNSTAGELQEAIHVSWDITAMFPNLDNESGVEVCRERLNDREIKHPSTECIIEAIVITLENNVSKFEDKVVRQECGAAIGPAHICSYADIIVDKKIDRKVMDAMINTLKHLIKIWARLRDDIYCLWKGTLEQLNEFNGFLNSLDEKLKFEMKASKEGVEFLDLFIFTKGDRIETKIWSKPCDPHGYLLPTSYHPVHIFEAIPYSVLSRVKRCCSLPEDFTVALEEYKGYLKDREYSDNVIQKAEKKLEKVSREQLLKRVDSTDPSNQEAQSSYKAKKKDYRCYPLVMRYNIKLPKMNNIIKKYQEILEWSPETLKLFPKGCIFVSYRVEPTIRNLLCKSGFPALNQNENLTLNLGTNNNENMGGCVKCDKQCKMCKLFLYEGEYAWSHNTKDKFKINKKLNCESNNIIYIINDNICKTSYTGYTTNTLKNRFANHKSHIKKNVKSCEIAIHIIESANTCHKLNRSNLNTFDNELRYQLSIMAIEEVEIPINFSHEQKIALMEAREDYWAANLKTKRILGGLNKRSTNG